MQEQEADDRHREASIPAEEHRCDTGSANANADADSAAAAAMESIAARGLKIFAMFYSMYGHVEGLAKRMKKEAAAVEAVLFRVPETLLANVLDNMKARRLKTPGTPEITAAELLDANGFLFGFPTRYGSIISIIT